MKKRFLLSFIILWGSKAFSQIPIQASIGIGSTPSSVKIYLKPASAITGSGAAATIATLQYCIALPATTLPQPTLSIVNTSVLSGYTVDGPRIVDGYLVYNLTTAVSGVVNIPAAETEAMEVKFSNGPAGLSSVSLATLGQGGSYDGNAIFYCSGAAESMSGNLYYARPGTVVTNTDSYNQFTNSFATIVGVALPVKLNSFTAVNNNNDGLLNWVSDNQSGITDHFDVERSTDGKAFAKIGRAEASSGNNSSYQYTDRNVDALMSPVIYYRIVSVAVNGALDYSEIRSIKVNGQPISVNVYPNPATDYIDLSYTLPAAEKVSVVISDAAGRILMRKEIASGRGNNLQRFDISRFAAGMYYLTLRTGAGTNSARFLK